MSDNPYNLLFQIERYIEEMKAAHKAKTTIRSHLRSLRYFREYLIDQNEGDDIRDIKKHQISRYTQFVFSRKGYSVDTKIGWLSEIRCFFDWLADQNLILSDPTTGIELPRKADRELPPYLTEEEVKTFLHAADPGAPRGLRDRAIMEVLYSTGMRNAECSRLTLADINFVDGTVRILEGKGSKDRTVPIGKTALYYIDRYVKEVRGPGAAGPLFRWMNEPKGMSTHQIWVTLDRYRKRSGLKRLYPHLLRHTFAVHMLENGADIRYIQEILGHEHLYTTQVYTQVVPIELKKAHKSSHPGEKRKVTELPDVDPRRLVNSNPGWMKSDD